MHNQIAGEHTHVLSEHYVLGIYLTYTHIYPLYNRHNAARLKCAKGNRLVIYERKFALGTASFGAEMRKCAQLNSIPIIQIKSSSHFHLADPTLN